MLFNTKWVSTIFPNHQGLAEDKIQINEIVTDSRVRSNKSLFVPIQGENFDAHDYIKQAFDNGAVAAMWNKTKGLPAFLPTDFPVFLVDDTLEALQNLASNYRKDVNPTVIGITGSNGKTTTKDIVASILSSSYSTHATSGNFNNEVGLPLTILSMPRDTEMLVLEMGMSNYGEIEALSRISQPDFGIITNIGESHIEYLGSRAGIAKAKSEIVKGMTGKGFLLVDGDESLLKNSIKAGVADVITCGFESENNVEITNVAITHDYTEFALSTSNNTYRIPLLGKHHALNTAFAVTLAKKLEIDENKIQEALLTLQVTSMRFEMIAGKNGMSIVNDAYNASPTSMKASIEVIKQMDGFAEKVLVLGDILELGEHSQSMHESVSEVIDESIYALYTLGDQAKHIHDKVKSLSGNITCKHFIDAENLIQDLDQSLNKDTLVLFKASRGMKFEQLVERIK
ncbi:UDP-N-acetylmuramoyl-tripeptide--D-alanyl-D-alanine ligase [Virgibacillus sp. DJP39]|uniref:UDP-N-acetylmuramoyl-tripeptide--D-alanyl-D- alanine ligase n=1 Tax=Virgibacillus sp. DJP39 TaxID=3409790 RepID=UPI003BB7FBD2